MGDDRVAALADRYDALAGEMPLPHGPVTEAFKTAARDIREALREQVSQVAQMPMGGVVQIDHLESVAANIVHQIGDALYDALPPDVAHDHFVTARQATNDRAIDFAKELIDGYCTQRGIGNEGRGSEVCNHQHSNEIEESTRT